jgi:hypothetical protein
MILIKCALSNRVGFAENTNGADEMRLLYWDEIADRLVLLSNTGRPNGFHFPTGPIQPQRMWFVELDQ